MRSFVSIFAFGFAFGGPVVGALSTPSSAHAEPAPKAAKPASAPAVDVKPALEKLKSGNEAKIQEALDDVRLAGPQGAAAAPAIADALARGLPLGLTQAAIETLGDVESEAGSTVLAQYAVHRDVKVRRAAVKALIRTKGPAASKALVRALSDSDAVVRGTAASGLGALKVKQAVGDLFVALDHRVNEAAASIGQLCTGAPCDDLLGKLGKLPFDVVTTGLEQMLFRPTSEINDDMKVKIVGHVRELGTIEGNKFLREIQKRAQAAGMSPRVRQAVDQAVLATSGGAR